ncbi:PTS glucose transporter subunit IIA, partial [Clostridioides difficile]
MNAGDKVKKGDRIVSFDKDKIEGEGYSIVTPIILTNTNDLADVIVKENKHIKIGTPVIKVVY